MATFNLTRLREEISYNGFIYKLDAESSAKLNTGVKIDTTDCILGKVLRTTLKGKRDVTGKPYEPTKWVFRKTNKTIKKISYENNANLTG